MRSASLVAALVRQPRTRAEALATARALQAAGWNFSVGLAQINLRNFERLGLSLESAFEPCNNLAAMQTVLVECCSVVVSLASSLFHPSRHRNTNISVYLRKKYFPLVTSCHTLNTFAQKYQ